MKASMFSSRPILGAREVALDDEARVALIGENRRRVAIVAEQGLQRIK